MTLKVHLQHALAAMTHFSTGQETVDVSDGPRHLQAELTALDTLACSFTRLSLRADSLKNRSPSELKRIAEQLSGKLTYLLEPISPIETDAEGCVVQMRSNPPQKEADCTSYYELLVARTGELSLARYSRNSGQLREVVAAHVTREVLCRLAGDLSAAAA
jgi:hypothetical protein